jgi:V/A-type H+-transporting ATPase subunit I
MIEKMNKYAFPVYHKDYDAFLEQLRALGVVHVRATKPAQDHPIMQQLKVEDQRIKIQLDYLQKLLRAEAEHTKTDNAALASATLSRKESEQTLIEVEALRDKLEKIQQSLASKVKERDAFSAWGDFHYANIERLRQAGYKTTFFTCPESRYDASWEDEYNALVINRMYSTVYFITITITLTDREVLTDADRVKMPMKDFKELSAEIDREYRNREETEAALFAIAQQHYESLERLKIEIENETAWNHVLIQTEREVDQKLMLLEGWIPANKTAEMEKTIANAGYHCMQLAITDDDVIPVKLKNNRFTRLFEPITKLYSLPDYKEFDPTPLFAPFFMLFFGLCLGDGGYGLLLIAAALILRSKVQESMKPIMTLVLYFGVTTLVIGILTGAFFGFSIVEINALSVVKQYFITSDNLMVLSLVIGFFHVIYAKFVAALKIKIQRGFKYSLSAFAWIFVILSLASVFVLPLADVKFPQPVEYALYGVAILCGLIALCYNTPGKNIFLNFGSGLWNAYNTVTGLVGDVLSYIRLYAIGLTSALLGGVFNSMAIDMTASMNPFIRWLPMLLILLVGHALNIGLSLISSMVHPLRLVYVEYFKNSEYEGGGIDYKPFRKMYNKK